MATITLDQVSAYALVSSQVVLTYTLEVKQHIANSIKQGHNRDPAPD